MKYILSLALFVTLLFSCVKEKIITKEVEKQHLWKSHASYQYHDVTLLNSKVSGNNLFIMGQNAFSTLTLDSLISADTLQEGQAGNFWNTWNDMSWGVKLPIGDHFIIFYNYNSLLRFMPSLTPGNGYSSINIGVIDMDTAFSSWEFSSYYTGECMAINNNNQALIPYFINNTNVDLKAFMVDIQSEKDEIGEIDLDTIQTRIISLPDEILFSLIQLCAIDDNFFITTSNEVFRISPEGEVKSVLDTRLYDYFKFNDKLYGISYDKLFCSVDQGNSWIELGSVNPDFTRLSYTVIDDRIVGYYNEQLFEIVINENEMYAVELQNDGLEGKAITSVSKLKNQVYVTTLSGLYYRLADKFFEGKNLIYSSTD